MSTSQSAMGGSNGAREFGANEWANAPWKRGGQAGWTTFELAAMVLGFIVFWPVGLAILGYKYWQGRNGGPDLGTVAANGWNQARDAMSGAPSPKPGASNPRTWARGFTAETGNRAFDEWKGAELSRLEAERQKLEDAHREFSEFVESVRKAKDREEFERFMAARRAPAGEPTTP